MVNNDCVNENKNLVGENYFYLLVQKDGYFMKTSFYDDFEEVSSWCENYTPVFTGKVKNSDWLHFKVGSIWHKKRISHLPISKSSDETLWYDVHELDLKNGSHIQKTKLGGKTKPEVVENL